MFDIRSRALLVASCLLYAPQAAASEIPGYGPIPAWVKQSPDPKPSTAADTPLFSILDVQQRIDGGEVWQYSDTAARIATSDMLEQFGTVRLSWQPDDSDIVIHRVDVIRDGNRIDQLAGGRRFTVIRREQKLEQYAIDGVLTATLAVEGLRVGDTLRLTSSIRRKDRTLGDRAQASMLLAAEPMRIETGRARLLWTPASPVRWKTNDPTVTAVERREDGTRFVEISLPRPKPEDKPQDAPSRFLMPPLLEASSFADWAAVAATMAPLYQTGNAIAAGSPLAAEVTRITKASSDPRTRAALALRLVQDEVRYLFNGMAGGNYRPQTAADTWSLRYGDCKAKTLLLLAILRDMGISAEAVLVNARLGDQVVDRLPAPGAFDHVIVRATIAGKSLWLDGTGRGTRLADLDDVPAFGHVLPVRAEGAALIALDATAPARAAVDTTLELDQSAGLKLPTIVRAKMTLRGPIAATLPVAWGQMPEKDRADLAAAGLADYFGETMIADYGIASDPDSGEVTVSATALAASPWRLDDGRYRATLDRVVKDFEINADRNRAAWRSIPVKVGDPGHVHVRTRVIMPKDIGPATLDGATRQTLQLGPTLLTTHASVSGSLVETDQTAVTTGAELPAQDLAATKTRLAEAKAGILTAVAPAGIPPRWRQVLDARKDKRLDAVRAAYAKAIARDAKNAGPYRNRAAFLSGIFEWKGALADRDRVIAIEPTEQDYLHRAGLHALLGDKTKALADADRAYALTGSADAVSAVASYRTATGDIAGALNLWDDRIAAGGEDKARYLVGKAETLSRAGRGPEAIAAIDAAVLASRNDPERLNSRCWLKGQLNMALDTALRDCTRAIELGDNPDAALDSRALIYFRMERYDEALADLDSALSRMPDLAASLYLRGVIRKRLGKPGSAEDFAAARLISPTIDADYTLFGIAS